MRRKPPLPPSASALDGPPIEEALAALGPEELRRLFRDILPMLDEKTKARVMHTLIDHAARRGKGWKPSGPTEKALSEALSFAEAAKLSGYADPSEVDEYLQQGTDAFFAKDYGAALKIFRAFLIPVSEGEIYIGYHEMPDEVLGIDLEACVARYVVAAYMTAAAADRAEAVHFSALQHAFKRCGL